LEVEANTRAVRVTYRAADTVLDQLFSVSEHSLGFHCTITEGTAWIANTEVLTFGMPFFSAIAFLRRLTLSAATSGIVGTRTGVATYMLNQIEPHAGMGSTGRWIMPAVTLIENPIHTGGPNVKSKNSRQDSPLLNVETCGLGAATSAPGVTGILTTSKNLATVARSVKAAIDTDLPPTVIYDHLHEGPFVMSPLRGLSLNATYPVAGTSQGVHFCGTLEWTEWQPKAVF
jgi:hypothetical protein